MMVLLEKIDKSKTMIHTISNNSFSRELKLTFPVESGAMARPISEILSRIVLISSWRSHGERLRCDEDLEEDVGAGGGEDVRRMSEREGEGASLAIWHQEQNNKCK
jgi:hypothetical protein